jgi:hypothetical protein
MINPTPYKSSFSKYSFDSFDASIASLKQEHQKKKKLLLLGLRKATWEVNDELKRI